MHKHVLKISGMFCHLSVFHYIQLEVTEVKYVKFKIEILKYNHTPENN